MVIFQVYFIYDSSSGSGTIVTTTSARIATTINHIIKLLDILCNILIILQFCYFICNGYVFPIQFIFNPTLNGYLFELYHYQQVY